MMIVLSRFFKLVIAALLVCAAMASFAQTENSAASDAPTELAETADSAGPTDFAGLVQHLASGSLSERVETVKKIADLKDLRSTRIIAALEQGNLYYDSALSKVAIKNEIGNYFDAISQSAISNDISNFKKIPVNNSLRNQLRSLLAQLNLGSEDESVRLTAVKRLLADGLDEESAAILAEKVQTEQNEKIQSSMNIALALFQLKDTDEKVRTGAVDKLRGSLEPEARSALTEASTNDESQAVRNTAISALKSIENTISYYRFAENVFFGLSLGSVLLLSAIGLAITFGVMGVINMAHG
jgi:urea transport system permease protein